MKSALMLYHLRDSSLIQVDLGVGSLDPQTLPLNGAPGPFDFSRRSAAMLNNKAVYVHMRTVC